MRLRTTIILLIAVVATGLYIQLGERYRETTDEKKRSARQALKFDPDRVSDLRIELPDNLYIISLSNNAWRIMSPVNAHADATAVMRIIDTIAELRKSEVITRDEMRDLGISPSAYGMEKPRATVTLRDGPREMTILVGRDSPGAHQLYLKLKDRDEIIVSDRDILDVLPSSVLNIRDRHLFRGQPGNVRRIELQTQRGTWQSSRDEQEQWMIERPVYARGLSGTIRQWLDGLYEFRVEDFVADSVAAGSLYGFDEPVAQVSIFTDQKSVPQILKIGRAADVEELSFYATIAGQEAVFTVTDDLLNWIQKDRGQFRDRRLLAIPGTGIGYIEITEGERSLQIARNTQNVWEVISPKRFVAYEARVLSLLKNWTGARAEKFIDPPYEKKESDALKAANRTIRFARTRPVVNAGAPISATNIAPVIRNEDITFIMTGVQDNDRIYLAPSDQAYIAALSPDDLTNISVNPLDYRDPVVLALDPLEIRRITQKMDGHEITVDRTNGTFRARSAENMIDPVAIDKLLSLTARLIAVRLIEEDAIDVKPYGLEKPNRSVILGLSGSAGINRVILIGQKARKGEVYAMVQGTDLVFTLPDESVTVLMNPVSNSLVPGNASPVDTSTGKKTE